MILCLIFIALFFLGALIYFAWRLARGHCADCELKTAQIVHLKQRLAGKELITPAMVQQRESVQQSAMGASPSHSDRSNPFDLENSIPVRSHFSAETVDEVVPSDDAKRASRHSIVSLFRNGGLSMEEHRELALAELERNHPSTQDSHHDEAPLPLWKRALAQVGLKNTAQRNDTEPPTGQRYQPMMRIYSDSGRAPIPPALRAPQTLQRTFSKPGPAPAPPAHAHSRRPVTNPYAFNPRSAYFEDTGEATSSRGSSTTVPRQYPQPPPAHSEFITVGLEDEESPAEAARWAAELREKRRTNGYGGMAPMVPDGMDGHGEFPVRMR
jgi:hypothetical protein